MDINVLNQVSNNQQQQEILYNGVCMNSKIYVSKVERNMLVITTGGIGLVLEEAAVECL